MNRLLQGDVGSGKTVVAALAILTAIESGYQAALMAPTEILAEQHLMTLTQLLEPLGVRGGAPHQRGQGQGARAGAARRPRTASIELRGRHPRARAGRRALPASRSRGGGRAAPLRREAARDPPGQGREPGRARDDRDADPAHARAHPLRRPRRLGHRRAAAGPQAGRHQGAHRVGAPADLRASCASRSSEGRQVYVVYPLVEESEALDLRAATEMADAPAARGLPRSPDRAAPRADGLRGEGAGHARVQGGRHPHPGLDHRDRGRASTCRTPR